MTFLPKKEEVSIIGYVCYSWNREGGWWANGGVGVLVHRV